MPDLGPMGRGGARRRTRRRMTAFNSMQDNEQETETSPQSEPISSQDSSDKLVKLAKLLKDKGIISESEYNLIFD
jgi:uncharacterized protein YacL